MIVFVTLFLGLFLGTHPLELRVDESVAAVELRMDGETVGRLEGPPWSGRLDFGQELVPHHLEALALDDDGRELSRTERWINLPRPPAEVSLFLEATGEGPRRARIFWESVLGTRPLSLRMELDGQPLPEATLAGVELPALDEGTIHFLRAELEFPDNLTTSAELVFGGGFQDAVDTDLTAVPVHLDDDRRITAGDLTGRLRADGEPLPVVAVEEGGVDLVLVPDAGAMSRLRNLALEWESTGSLRTAFRTSRESHDEQVKRTLPLPREQRLRFLWPFPQIRRGMSGIPFNLFVSTPELTHDDGGLVWLISRTAPPGGLDRDTRLTTAVAVAGTIAASRNRRRGVVLLWTGGEGDRSRIPAQTVRRFLADLRVPFEVWSLGAASEVPGTSETAESPETTGWGPAKDVSTLLELERAYKDLTRDLERQRIVWVSGTRLPQSVSVAPGSGRIELARSPVVPKTDPAAGADTAAGAPGSIAFHPDAPRPWRRPPSPSEPSSSSPSVLEALSELPEGPDTSLFDLGRPRDRIPVEEGVRLKAVPEPEAPHLAVVDADVELPVVERRGEWARVTYRNRSGWVRVSPEGQARVETVAPLPPPEVTVLPSSPVEATARQRGDRRALAAVLLGGEAGSLGSYDLLTDVEDGELLAVLDRLASSLDPVFESRYGLAPAPPEPDEAVLLFAREEVYRRYASEEGEDLAALGLAAHAGGGLAALFVGERDREQVTALLVHELTHLVTQRTLGPGLPPWLEEGLADDLAYSRIARDGRLEPDTLGGASSLREERRSLGRGVERVEQTQEISGGRAALLRLARLVDDGSLPTLETLVGLSRKRFLESEDRSLYYPLSAFFVRFLLADESALAFRRVLADVAEGSYLTGELLLARLETDWGTLQRRFESWLRSEARRLGPG